MAQLRRDGRLEDISPLATLEEYHNVLRFSQYADLESTLGGGVMDPVDAG
jgi:hypothetical protein